MLHLENNRKIWHHIIQGSHYLFADERNKKRLLDLVLEVQKKKGWKIYAFCLTDHKAYFIIEAEQEEEITCGIRQIKEKFLAKCRKNMWAQPVARLEFVSNELRTFQEVADCFRRIHRIPLEMGYVDRIGDYWWSSYITYMGNYEWSLVDCERILLHFSDDPQAARRKLRVFHHADSCLL